MSAIPHVGQKILVLWGGTVNKDGLVENVEKLRSSVGSLGSVAVENIDRLTVSDHASSSFDVVYYGTVSSLVTAQPTEILTEIARILKPGGCIVMREIVAVHDDVPNLQTAVKLASALKLSGFTSISKPETIPEGQIPVEHSAQLEDSRKELSVVEFKAFKPSFEIGSSIQLPFSKKAVSKPDENVSKMWKLSIDDTLDENVELINEDDLLDEDDLKKPDPTSLRVCATTKKRKACKNCSCGLAEELENEKKAGQSKTANSACGNCYLGDAFRCASCPYLGMPAFKPGEKISLTERQLKADV